MTGTNSQGGWRSATTTTRTTRPRDPLFVCGACSECATLDVAATDFRALASPFAPTSEAAPLVTVCLFFAHVCPLSTGRSRGESTCAVMRIQSFSKEPGHSTSHAGPRLKRAVARVSALDHAIAARGWQPRATPSRNGPSLVVPAAWILRRGRPGRARSTADHNSRNPLAD